MEIRNFISRKYDQLFSKQEKEKVFYLFFVIVVLFLYFDKSRSLTDIASIATILALFLTMESLRHSARSLKETKTQIEQSNVKAVASSFLSRLDDIFQNFSYRYDKDRSETVTGRAAIMDAFISIDGHHDHYFSVDLLGGYFKFYLQYLKFLVTNKETLDRDYEAHLAAVEQDFILIKNEMFSLVGNLKLVRSSNNQYYSVDTIKKAYDELVEFHRTQILGSK